MRINPILIVAWVKRRKGLFFSTMFMNVIKNRTEQKRPQNYKGYIMIPLDIIVVR